jgi:hypothetical protein
VRSFRPPVIAMVLGWVLVVVLVGTVTYVVVDTAGQGVGRASAARTPLTVVQEPAAAPSTAASTPTPKPSSTPTPTPSTHRTSSTPRPATTRPRTTTAPAPAPRPAPRRSSTPPPTTPTPTSTTRTAAFTTDGGTVVVSCTAATIHLDSITPRDGWGYERDVSGGHVEVQFKSGEREIELHIGCVRGVPTRVDN